MFRGLDQPDSPQQRYMRQMEVSVVLSNPEHEEFAGGKLPLTMLYRPSCASRLLFSFSERYAFSTDPSSLRTVAMPTLRSAQAVPRGLLALSIVIPRLPHRP